MDYLFAFAAALFAIPTQAADFTLESPDLVPGARLKPAQVYRGYGCEGGNQSPDLAWHGAPAGTRSFAVTVFDPDAPTDHGWWHWAIYDIPAQVTALPAGAGNPARGLAPAGSSQAINDFGTPGFGGACPPAGDKAHRYVFTVYALKVERLELPANAKAAEANRRIGANALGKASLTATYSR